MKSEISVWFGIPFPFYNVEYICKAIYELVDKIYAIMF
jgi:hypothetical protein